MLENYNNLVFVGISISKPMLVILLEQEQSPGKKKNNVILAPAV
jgi:hypothetical protein